MACLRQELDKYESRLATVLDNATAAERMLERLVCPAAEAAALLANSSRRHISWAVAFVVVVRSQRNVSLLAGISCAPLVV